MAREYPRKLRVGSELQRLLNELLQQEIKDPRLAQCRVTDVEVSGDLGVAKVFFGTLAPDEDPEPAIHGFEKASGFLRAQVGRRMRLRRVPELRFIHDRSARQGERLSRLIDEVTGEEPTGP